MDGGSPGFVGKGCGVGVGRVLGDDQRESVGECSVG